MRDFLAFQCSVLLSVNGSIAIFRLVTSSAGAVAKYCNERVCVCLSLCVCLSVCLSASISSKQHARYLPIFLCSLLIAVDRSSSDSSRVMKSQRKGKCWSFLSHWQCIVHHSIWDPYKNSWINRDAAWVNASGGPRYHVLNRRPDPPRKGKFWGNVAAHSKVMGQSTVRGAKKKRLNRSTCRFGWRLEWAHETKCRIGVQIPEDEGAFWELFGYAKVLAIFAATVAAALLQKVSLKGQ